MPVGLGGLGSFASGTRFPLQTGRTSITPPPESQVPLSAADLASLDDHVEDRFMREVYDRQVAISTQLGLRYAAGVPATELERLPTSLVRPGRTVSVRRDVFGALTGMVTDARTALVAAQRSGAPDSAGLTDLRVLSGYRSARDQLSIWEREYAKYYRDTRIPRRALPGGEHGSDAIDYLANYINQRVFCPGYSPHQHGRTVDLTYQQHRRWSAADTSVEALRAWRSSWFFGWLSLHAPRYGFKQNSNIDEPWHWEYRAPTVER